MKRNLLLPALLFCLIVCGFTVNKFQTNLTTKLVGEWRNVYVRVKIVNSKNGETNTVEADSTDWEIRLGIKPIRTHFKSNGTYLSEYRNLKDSVIRRNSGTWFIQNDTLNMAQIKPTKSLLKLHVSINGDHATFHGMIDFDGAGQLDDEYFGVQKRFGD